MKRTILALLLSTTTAVALYACGGDDSNVGNNDNDSGGSQSDGSSPNDGSFKSDTSTGDDSGGGDGGTSPTSLQIQAVKTAAPALPDGGDPGPVTLNLPIDHALVTYVRPVVGTDPAGFFLQAEQTGPAVFVAIDPTTLTPVPAVGDDVSLTVTTAENVVSLHEITAISGLKVNSHGNDIAPLLRHVGSAADLVSKLDNYESEYIELDGFIASAFGGSAGSVSAEVTTAAFASPSSTLKLRIPPEVQTHYDVELTCQFSLTGIMWRFGKNAEPSGWADADLTTVTCSAPKVVSAIAPTQTTVNVVFDRDISGSSLVANGGQFTITDSADAGVGPSVSGAVLQADLRTVTLTTSPQAAGEPLKVAVTATTLDDVLAKPVDPAHNFADFSGYVTPATLRLNELNPNISSAPATHDLIELQVLTAGNLVGIQLVENLVANKVLLATLPNLEVAAGDIVVVHLDADFADGGPNLITNETTTKGDCTLPACYANAWDVSDTNHGQNGMTFSARVIAMKDGTGAIMDGISWWKSTGSRTGLAVETNALIDAGMWPSCGAGTYCDSEDAAVAIAVDTLGVASNGTGPTIARIPEANANTHSAADWMLTDGGTFGIVNP